MGYGLGDALKFMLAFIADQQRALKKRIRKRLRCNVWLDATNETLTKNVPQFREARSSAYGSR
jgi:hypothetical protein